MCVMEPLNTAGNWEQEPVLDTHLRDIPEEQGSWGALTPNCLAHPAPWPAPGCQRESGGQRPSGKEMLVLAFGGQACVPLKS